MHFGIAALVYYRPSLGLGGPLSTTAPFLLVHARTATLAGCGLMQVNSPWIQAVGKDVKPNLLRRGEVTLAIQSGHDYMHEPLRTNCKLWLDERP